ncbi:MAG: sigma-54-dependent Fis family transcriptional regulator [Planctomycetes bacterium]|nr:sigma-54-dependent Fis family transcriptional regulator [Planctomycetota bacterium]
MSHGTVLVVDDEADLRWVVRNLLRDAGLEVLEAGDADGALALARDHSPDVVLSDVRMPGRSGVELLEELRRLDGDLPVILFSALEEIDTAVQAMKKGAYDYLAKPFDPQRLVLTVQRAAEQRGLRREVDRLRAERGGPRAYFGESAAARELERVVELVAARTSLAVLVLGESGTGKEVVAREIHRRSPQAAGPFVAVDCGALPEPLMESQLFGHRRGAFTGADQDRPGLFRMAEGGTLFLDELGNLPLALQAKLLRTLQERAVTPVGGGEPIPFRTRLLCATNQDLQRDVEAGQFRMDLYHRVAEFVLRIPPLRERPEDIRAFALRFLREANEEMGREVRELSPEALGRLQASPWHGNLRELRNAIRRAVLICPGATLETGEFAPAGEESSPTQGSQPVHGESGSLAERVRRRSDRLEAEILRDTLERCGGNKAAAARALQIDYTTLHRKLKRHGL